MLPKILRLRVCSVFQDLPLWQRGWIGRGMLAGIDCVWRRVDVSLSGTHLFHRDHLVAAAPCRATVGLESLPARGIRVND